MMAALSAAPLAAQYWSKPASTPNTDVKCATCPSPATNKLTAGYPTTLGKYVGRYLDSSTTNDFQQHFRTARARNVLMMPSTNRLYFIIGSGVMAYNADKFFQRVGAGEQLAPVKTVPVPWSPYDRLGSIETFLLWDQFFYAENLPTAWDTPTTDGQERLYGIDVDDRNNVYLAYTLFGWGIVKDDLKTDESLMTSEYQYGPTAAHGDDVQPNVIAAVKTSAGRYYAIVSDAASPVLNVFDATTPTSPVRQASVRGFSMVHFAKTTDMNTIGFVTADGQFNIYTADALVSGGRASLSTTGPGGAPIRAVATDGTNFYVSADVNTGLVISTYAPDASGGGYHKVTDYRSTRPTLQSMNLKYGDGYLTHASITDGGYELRLFKASVNNVSEVDLSIPTTGYSAFYFKNYYVSTGRTGYVAVGPYGQFIDSATVKQPGHTYLVVTGYGLGDVYELQGAGALGVSNLGSKGTVNPNRPAGASAGPFYGDPVGFNATTGANAQTNIQWDFGNPESSTVAADPNTMNGLTGTPVTHRYSGITSLSSLPLSRTVNATSIADSNVTGAVHVTIATPAVSAGIKNYAPLALQPNASSTAPIVYGDSFVDMSDGSAESHFTTWSIDGKPVNATPLESIGVGGCAGHTLSVTGHYGPYTGTSPNEVSLSDLPISISGQYSVKPFVAAISLSSNGTSITFSSASRLTADTTVLSAAQIAAMQYKWELLGANNAVLQTGPTGTNAASIPAFTVAKSVFTSRGIRAHLVLTSPTPVAGACAGLNMETSEAFTAPLNGPDPVVNGDCTNGAPPCSFNVGSASGVNQVSDGWTYSWSATPASTVIAPSTTLQTYTPNFTQVGSYNVSVTVTNAVGSTTASKSVSVTTAGSVCQVMSNVNLVLAYAASDSSCYWPGTGGTCTRGKSVAFNVSAGLPPYDFSCAAHSFSWSFGDGTTATGQSVSHTYNSAGSFTVTVTVTNPSQTFTMSQAVQVGGTVVPPPYTPPPVTPPTTGSCGTMTPNSTVYIGYSTPSFSCSYTSPTTPCSTADAIYFYAFTGSGYDFTCATHSFQWRYGDGNTATGQNPAPHSYAAAGTYTVSLTISSPTQSVTLTQPVTITGGSTQQPPPVTPPNNGSCGTMAAGSNVFIGYSTQSFSCSYTTPGTACPLGDPIYVYAFTGTGYDFTCGTHTFQWNYGDGATATGKNPSPHVYAAAGTYNVTVAITNPASQTVTVTQAITVGGTTTSCGTITPNQSISFNYAGSKSACTPTAGSCTTCDTLTFTITTPNNTYNLGCATHVFQWDFGDGSARVTGTSAVHQFPSAGTYNVKLLVTVNGTTTEIPRSVNVASCSGQTPNTFPFDFTVAPMTVTVSNTIVIVPDNYIFTVFATDGKSTSSMYQWDFGDGSTASGPNPQVVHPFPNANNYTVTLTVPGFGTVTHNLLVHKRPSSHR